MLTFPLTGETYSKYYPTKSTANMLSLSIASDVSTTNSFYGAYACKNWVLASGRDAELVPEGHRRGREGSSVRNFAICSLYVEIAV